eukprot:gene39175-52950_t
MFDLIPDPSSSSAVRKFLFLQFAKELIIDVDHTIILPYLLNAIYFLLISNSTESTEISVKESLFTDSIKSTCLLPICLWLETLKLVLQHLKTTRKCIGKWFVQLFDSKSKVWPRHQNLRILLFSLPVGEKQSIAARADPRLARSMKAASATATTSTTQQVNTISSSEFSFNSTTTYTADLILLHHPFINRNELVLEAEDVMSKALIWLTSNKSAESTQSGTLFSPSLMAVLAEVVANIAGVRPKYCNNAAAAIAFMISSFAMVGKAGSEVCQQM